jgi:hypothetical protein
VSHPRKAGLLAHYQPLDVRPRTHILVEVAEIMVGRLVAERITRKLYRLLPPDSPFPVAKFCPESRRYVPEKLPPREVNGTYFQAPQSETWRRQHRMVTFMPRETECGLRS